MESIHFDDTEGIDNSDGINIENPDAILEKLILDNNDTLLGFASYALSSPDNAEDAVQETYLVAQTKRSEMLSSQNPAGWLVDEDSKEYYRRHL